MIEVLGTVVSYVYQIAVILFVLKEFGLITSPFAKQAATSSAGASGPAAAPAGFDIGGLMQGLMKGIQEQGNPQKKGKKRAVEAEGQVAEVD